MLSTPGLHHGNSHRPDESNDLNRARVDAAQDLKSEGLSLLSPWWTFLSWTEFPSNLVGSYVTPFLPLKSSCVCCKEFKSPVFPRYVSVT